jgi:hypothetical protein
MGGPDAGYPAKALGVARSDLEHCADLQATLRPEKSTSGVLSLSFIGSVFYASLISDVDYMPNGLQHSSRLDAGPLLREERTSIIRCLRSAFDPKRTLTNRSRAMFKGVRSPAGCLGRYNALLAWNRP